MNRVLRSPAFWLPFTVSLVLSGGFFLWELGYFQGFLPSLLRPQASAAELLFTAALALLLSFNAGLVVWQSRYGHCPLGVKRASSVAGAIGALTLICPACVLLPASLIGASFFFAYVSPFLPLLRAVAVILLVVASAMLWSKKK